MGYFDSMLGAPPQSSKVTGSDIPHVCVCSLVQFTGERIHRAGHNLQSNNCCCYRRMLLSSPTMQLSGRTLQDCWMMRTMMMVCHHMMHKCLMIATVLYRRRRVILCPSVYLRLVWPNLSAASMAFIRNIQREGWYWWIEWCNNEVSLQHCMCPQKTYLNTALTAELHLLMK